MMMVCAFLFWLVVVPFCMGHIPAYFLPRRHQNPGTVFLSGYLFEWAVFEVLAIPILIWGPGQNFHLLTRLFSIIAILLSIGGILLRLLFYKKTGRGFFADALPSKEHLRHLGAEQWVLWALFAVLLGFQLYMAITRTSFDGDDAYYVVQSLLAQETGTMYKYLPYTGGTTSLDVRHALALLPMWIAFLAVKANLHATITAHLVMPIVLIPLSYLVFYEIGTALFRKKREDIPVFLLILELLQIFGNVSIYTNETFFLTRTWQGKAVVGSVIIPSLFLLMLWIYEEKEETAQTEISATTATSATTNMLPANRQSGLWFLLVCLHIAAGLCSSIAVFLLVIILALMAICLAIAKRKIRVLWQCALTCIPSAVYVLIYVLLK